MCKYVIRNGETVFPIRTPCVTRRVQIEWCHRQPISIQFPSRSRIKSSLRHSAHDVHNNSPTSSCGLRCCLTTSPSDDFPVIDTNCLVVVPVDDDNAFPSLGPVSLLSHELSRTVMLLVQLLPPTNSVPVSVSAALFPRWSSPPPHVPRSLEPPALYPVARE